MAVSVRKLFRKAGRVGGCVERFHGKDRRCGMVAVSAERRGEACDDHVRLEHADHPHDVGEGGVVVPEAHRFVGGSWKSRSR